MVEIDMAFKITSKISGSHTTLIDAAETVVRQANKIVDVRKISLGLIKNTQTGGRSPRNIKIKDTDSGLELTVRGSLYIQTIFLYLDNPEKSRHLIASEIIKAFNKGH